MDGMSLGMSAFTWGIISAISLPFGAFVGLWWRPNKKINSAFMAFGGGALLFALSIELFGHIPHHVSEHGLSVYWVAALGALLGGLVFDLLNTILNNQGAFVRKISNAKDFVLKLKVKRTKKLISELCKIKILQGVSAKDLALLVQSVELEKIKKNKIIFNENDEANEMYFILSGEVQIFSTTEDKKIALLNAGESFGELGMLNGGVRTAGAQAVTEVRVYKLSNEKFKELFSNCEVFKDNLKQLATDRLDDLSLKVNNTNLSSMKKKVMHYVNANNLSVTDEEIKDEQLELMGSSKAALAIWLGILIDGVPESLVIGMLCASPLGMSTAFIAGVFLANLPEAMSSAVSMRKSGMSLTKIYIMWGSICLLTGVGAFIGAEMFSPEPTGSMFYWVLGIEGLAAGAMLTMIAETMLPEAFEQGGRVVGLSTLGGFLAALFVKVL